MMHLDSSGPVCSGDVMFDDDDEGLPITIHATEDEERFFHSGTAAVSRT